MEIVKLNSDTLKDMNKTNEPFEIIGKLILCFIKISKPWSDSTAIFWYLKF